MQSCHYLGAAKIRGRQKSKIWVWRTWWSFYYWCSAAAPLICFNQAWLGLMNAEKNPNTLNKRELLRSSKGNIIAYERCSENQRTTDAVNLGICCNIASCYMKFLFSLSLILSLKVIWLGWENMENVLWHKSALKYQICLFFVYCFDLRTTTFYTIYTFHYLAVGQNNHSHDLYSDVKR